MGEVAGPVVVLAGGTGGAKLARGMQDVVDDRLVVIANTGDDLEIYGTYVSPDPDLVTFWLADAIDQRGWGLKDDTFNVMETLRELGDDVWFNLGDRDFAICLRRAQRLAQGARLTEVIREAGATLGVHGQVLPMSDDPVRTWIQTDGEWIGFQEFMIVHQAASVIEAIEYRGAESAQASPEALAAIDSAQAIIIGPSNPVISIGPILAIEQIFTAISHSDAPVVAVSPLVNGEVVKGPTESCLQWARKPLSADGIVDFYGELIDGFVSDEPAVDVITLRTSVEMGTAAQRQQVARETLSFCTALAQSETADTGASH